MPVKSLFGSTQGDDDINVIALLDILQIVLHHIALFQTVFHQIGYLQQTAVSCPDGVNSGIIVLILQLTNHFHDLSRFLILTQACRSPLVHAGNMDDGLLRGVEHFANMVQIRSVIEVVAQDQILQILVTVQLLIIIVGNGIELRFILSPQYWYAVASEVRTCHRYDMSGRIVHHPAHHIAQVRVGICAGMVELVNRQQHMIERIVVQFLHTVTQGGMGTDQYLRPVILEELQEASFLIRFVLHIRQIEIGRHDPVGKEAAIHQIGILKRSADTLLRHSHHHLLNTLMSQLIQRDIH